MALSCHEITLHSQFSDIKLYIKLFIFEKIKNSIFDLQSYFLCQVGTKTDYIAKLANGPPFAFFEVGNVASKSVTPPPFGKFPTLYRFLDLIASLRTFQANG